MHFRFQGHHVGGRHDHSVGQPDTLCCGETTLRSLLSHRQPRAPNCEGYPNSKQPGNASGPGGTCAERTTSSLGGRMSETTTTRSPAWTSWRRLSSAKVRSTFSSGSAPKSRRKGITPQRRFSRARTSCLSAPGTPAHPRQPWGSLATRDDEFSPHPAPQEHSPTHA